MSLLLLVCLLAETIRKVVNEFWWFFLAVVGRITSNKRLNFGGNADHDADLGIFIGIFERNDCMNLAGNLRSYYEVFDG